MASAARGEGCAAACTQKESFTLLDLPVCVCVSSLRRGQANLLRVAPMLTDDPRRASLRAARLLVQRDAIEGITSYHIISYYITGIAGNMCIHTYIYIYMYREREIYTH